MEQKPSFVCILCKLPIEGIPTSFDSMVLNKRREVVLPGQLLITREGKLELNPELNWGLLVSRPVHQECADREHKLFILREEYFKKEQEEDEKLLAYLDEIDPMEE